VKQSAIGRPSYSVIFVVFRLDAFQALTDSAYCSVITLDNVKWPVASARQRHYNQYICSSSSGSAILTTEADLSEAGVDTDFEAAEVDIARRQADRANGVGKGDRAGQLEQSDVGDF